MCVCAERERGGGEGGISPLVCFPFQILDKTQEGFFPIFLFLVKSIINKNCYNSRTSNDIDVKPGPVTTLDKRNMATWKKFNSGVMPTNYDVIVFFLIYGWFGAIWKPDSWQMFYDFYIFINSNILSYKKWKQN